MKNFIIKYILGMFFEENKIYFVSPEIYALLVYDVIDNEVKVLAEYPEELWINAPFEKIIKVKDKILLFPCYANDIYIYDTKNNIFLKSNILENIEQEMNYRKVFSVLLYNNKIFCISRIPNFIIEIESDLSIHKIHYFDKSLVEKVNHRYNVHFSGCVKNECIVYPVSDNKLVEFSINTSEFRVINLLENKKNNIEKSIYNCITHLSMDHEFGEIWLTNYVGEIYRIDNNAKKRIILDEHELKVFSRYNTENSSIVRIINNQELLFIILKNNHNILVYNTKTGISSWKTNDFKVKERKKNEFIYTIVEDMGEQHFLIYSFNDGKIFVCNREFKFEKTIVFALKEEEILKNKTTNEGYLKYISERDDLKSFISYICK